MKYIWILFFSICFSQINSQNRTFYGVGTNGDNHTGVFFKIDEQTCNVSEVISFNQPPFSLITRNIVSIGDKRFGTAMVGGKSNTGGIFRLNEETSSLEELVYFEERYTATYLLNIKNKLLCITGKRLNANHNGSEKESYYYQFHTYDLIDNKLVLINKDTILFEDHFLKIETLNEHLLLARSSKKVYQIDLNMMNTVEVFDFNRNKEKYGLPKEMINNLATGFVSNDFVINGLFLVDPMVDLDSPYNLKTPSSSSIVYMYQFDMKKDVFHFRKLWNNKNLDAIKSINGERSSISFGEEGWLWEGEKANYSYQEGKILFYEENRKRFYIAAKNKHSDIKFKLHIKAIHPPVYSYLSDSSVFYFAYHKENQERYISLFEYDYYQKEHKKVIHLSDEKKYVANSFLSDYLVWKESNSWFSLLPDALINLEVPDSINCYQFSKGDRPLLSHLHWLKIVYANNDHLYIRQRYNFFRYDLKKEKTKYLSSISERDRFFQLDSCRILFACSPERGRHVEYNMCKEKIREFQRNTDSLNHYLAFDTHPYMRNLRPDLSCSLYNSSFYDSKHVYQIRIKEQYRGIRSGGLELTHVLRSGVNIIDTAIYLKGKHSIVQKNNGNILGLQFNDKILTLNDNNPQIYQTPRVFFKQSFTATDDAFYYLKSHISNISSDEEAKEVHLIRINYKQSPKEILICNLKEKLDKYGDIKQLFVSD